ncbi:MAG: penicillin acylase family protein [Parvibaculum sp.]|uniref:penicillin acylase family protein n=1 Tax=Parvibaculum sp. TaxID=2024848 RepID=UPI00272FA976|nr:penicillin acylase family protein [Parvibaculum sp.]MDP2149250.1 penicillin acylase family protein [Parvibaculum sp.]
MKWLQRTGLLLLALLVLGALALGTYVYRSHPALDGELRAPGLTQPVKVSRDAADVTHIEAASERDAWFALGYVHAQERGWQLEFNRRVMHGKLSEILGEATLETDKLLRTLGIMQAAERQLAALPAEAQQAVQAYADGINAFYAASPQALQPEFHVLGTRPGGDGPAWTAADSVGWSLMMALDLGGNWGNEFARLNALQVLDTPALWELMPPYPGERPVASADLARLYAEWGIFRKSGTQSQAPAPTLPPATLLAGTLRTDLARWAQDFADHLGTVDGKGSNNWVIAGSRSASGKPIVANDPHLSLSAPAIWYFARMKAPGLDVMGASFPGLPFVVLGRTRQVAWGFTNTAPDVQDLYLERIHPDQPGQYQTPESWAAFETREETIRVKGKPDVKHTVRSTRHGPVLSDAQASHQQLLDTQRYVIALRWTALDTDNRTLLAGIRSNRAQSVDDLLAAYEDFIAPMQSVVMADTSGRTAFKTTGRVPLRHPDNDIMGVAPSPGWDARYDWVGWLPYAQTPQADSAAIEARGWLATANQRIHAADFPHFLTQDWELPYRQDRIDALLARPGLLDLDAQMPIHGDLASASAQGLLPHLVKSPVTHPLGAAAQQALAGFDGELRADSAAALIFSVWTDEFTRGVIGGRLGQERLMAIYGKRVFRAAIEGILARDDTAWCGEAGCAAASGQALDRALARIEAMQGSEVSKWQWGTAHPAISAHRPFSNVGALARFFDVRVPTGGDRFTVNMGHFHADHEPEPFANRHGPSMRALYDLANLENSRFIYQTGQSGLVFSRRYRDMSEEWAAVRYRPLQMDPPGFAHRLTLVP